MNDSRRQTIAEYDNATLYNDYVFESIVKQYENKNAVVIYFSDHGEEIYDYRDVLGRVGPDESMIGEFKASMFDVPFMIWMSDEFISQNPETVERIKAASALRGSTDCVGHTILGLAGFKSAPYKAEYDILSVDYKPFTRKTLENINYD